MNGQKKLYEILSWLCSIFENHFKLFSFSLRNIHYVLQLNFFFDSSLYYLMILQIIVICWFGAQETFVIVINVENSCEAQYFLETLHIRLFWLLLDCGLVVHDTTKCPQEKQAATQWNYTTQWKQAATLNVAAFWDVKLDVKPRSWHSVVIKIPGCPSKKSRRVTPASWPNLPKWPLTIMAS